MMKSFDFPVLINYVVGNVCAPKQNNQKNLSLFKSHIDLDKLGKQQVAPCKQFLFSKRKLIDIKPTTLIKIQPQATSSSQDSSKRNTAPFREYLMRKTLSHRTNFMCPKQNSFNTNKSLQSQKSIVKIFAEQTSNTNRSSLNGLKKASLKIIQEKKQKKRIRFEDEQQNSNIEKQDEALNSSKHAGSRTTSKQQLGSKRLIERHKTENDDSSKQFTSKKLKSVKRVTKLLSRKNTITANLTNKSHIQKSQSQQQIEKNKSFQKLKVSKKKATFPDHELDSNSSDGERIKTFKSSTKKTLRSKGTMSKLTRQKSSNQVLSLSKKSFGMQKDKKSRCSIFLKEQQIGLLKQLKLDQKDYTLQMKSQLLISNIDKEELKNFLRKKYRAKSQKLLRPHDPDFGSDFKGTLNKIISNTSLNNLVKKTPNAKILKKKKPERQRQVHQHVIPYSSRKIAKRIKKTSKDEAHKQQEINTKKQQGGLGDKLFQQKSTFFIKKPQTINAFTELNLFHTMMKQYRDLLNQDKNDKDNAKQTAPNKPFAIMGQQTDKRDFQALEDRMRQFKYEEMMIKFSKTIMTNTNKLKQINYHIPQ